MKLVFKGKIDLAKIAIAVLFITIIVGQFFRIDIGIGRLTVIGMDLAASFALLIFLSVLAIRKKIPTNKIIFVLFFLLAVTILTTFKEISTHSSTEFLTAISYLVRWFTYIAAGLFIGFSFTKNGLASFFKWFFISCFILVIAGFIQLLVYPDLIKLANFGWDPHLGRLVSTWFDPNYLGGFFAFSAAFSLSFAFNAEKKSIKKMLWALTLFLALATLLTFSRSAYFALGLSFGIVAFIKNKRVFIAGILLAVMAIILIPRASERIMGVVGVDATAQSRLESWSATNQIVQDNWFSGIGANFMPYELLKRGAINNIETHAAAGSDSSLLNIFAMTGIFGIVLTLIVIILVLKYSWKLSRGQDWFIKSVGLGIFAGTVSLLFHSNFVNSLFYPFIMMVFWIMIGILINLYKSKKQVKILEV